MIEKKNKVIGSIETLGESKNGSRAHVGRAQRLG